MNNWYTRQEVADILGIAKTTVYHYAKQGKITKLNDPHRTFREARYEREEVDALAEERKRNQPTGLRPSQLARKLRVPVSKIYSVIKEENLTVDEFPLGDEMIGYSIPDTTAQSIEDRIESTKPIRGTRSEYFNSQFDITLYQLFQTPNGNGVRVIRDENLEWGFPSQSLAFIPFEVGTKDYLYKPAYNIHKKNRAAIGYTDFILPKNGEESYDLLDFVYQTCGIENIRLRENELDLALSIKSGTYPESVPFPTSVTDKILQTVVTSGEALFDEGGFVLVSGYRRTTVDLPIALLNEIEQIATPKNLTMSEFIERAVKEALKKD